MAGAAILIALVIVMMVVFVVVLNNAERRIPVQYSKKMVGRKMCIRDRTIVVAIEDHVKHPLIGKIVKKTVKLKAHEDVYKRQDRDLPGTVIKSPSISPAGPAPAGELIRLLKP